MIRLNSDVHVYLATTPVDGRKAINGLSAFIIEEFEATLMDGSVFVFL
jgi:transposase